MSSSCAYRTMDKESIEIYCCYVTVTGQSTVANRKQNVRWPERSPDLRQTVAINNDNAVGNNDITVGNNDKMSSLLKHEDMLLWYQLRVISLSCHSHSSESYHSSVVSTRVV